MQETKRIQQPDYYSHDYQKVDDGLDRRINGKSGVDQIENESDNDKNEDQGDQSAECKH